MSTGPQIAVTRLDDARLWEPWIASKVPKAYHPDTVPYYPINPEKQINHSLLKSLSQTVFHFAARHMAPL
jgi:hypothetical protein